jgi:putative transcription factor
MDARAFLRGECRTGGLERCEGFIGRFGRRRTVTVFFISSGRVLSVMICELCGKTFNQGFRIRLEGGVVSACEVCSKLGEVVASVKPQAPKPKPKPVEALEPKPEPVASAVAEYDLVDDFGAKVKAAREKHGWTQEEMGKFVNEPHSLIHRIEHGRFEPTLEVARKLEHKLGVKLVEVRKEVEFRLPKPDGKDVTLGDMLVVRKRNKE